MRSTRDFMSESQTSYDNPFLPIPLKRSRTLQRLATSR